MRRSWVLFLTVGSDELGLKPGDVVEKPKKRVKKGKTKHRGFFDLLRVRAALSSGSKVYQRT